jgi:ribosomal protein L3
MGGARISALNLRVIGVQPENNIIFVRGAVPGKEQSVVRIRQSNRVAKG